MSYKPKNKSCRTAENKNKIRSLENIVKHYKRYIDQCSENTLPQELEYFGSLSFNKMGLKKIANAKLANGKKHTHQKCLDKKVFPQVSDRLLNRQREISNVQTFSELFKKVSSIIKDINGVGPLMIYDTTLRLGAILGLKPQKVYIHRGSKEGAKNLGLNIKKGYLEKDELPNEFQDLEPYEIEDCLCIYKDSEAFKRMSSAT